MPIFSEELQTPQSATIPVVDVTKNKIKGFNTFDTWDDVVLLPFALRTLKAVISVGIGTEANLYLFQGNSIENDWIQTNFLQLGGTLDSTPATYEGHYRISGEVYPWTKYDTTAQVRVYDEVAPIQLIFYQAGKEIAHPYYDTFQNFVTHRSNLGTALTTITNDSDAVLDELKSKMIGWPGLFFESDPSTHNITQNEATAFQDTSWNAAGGDPNYDYLINIPTHLRKQICILYGGQTASSLVYIAYTGHYASLEGDYGDADWGNPTNWTNATNIPFKMGFTTQSKLDLSSLNNDDPFISFGGSVDIGAAKESFPPRALSDSAGASSEQNLMEGTAAISTVGDVDATDTSELYLALRFSTPLLTYFSAWALALSNGTTNTELPYFNYEGYVRYRIA